MTKTIATLYCAELEGIHARLIEIEVDLNVGLHSFSIVGLADKALSEAKERVNSAIKNIGAKPPNRENRRITINLAPADIKKAGSQYDLAIALGYLRATNQVAPFEANTILFLGELALDGRLRPINGALNIAELARKKNFSFLFLPAENAAEASVVQGIAVIPIGHLQEAIDILENKKIAEPIIFSQSQYERETDELPGGTDFSEIKGQAVAKRALTIAASGGHNLLMSGPPGVGKSLLAQALSGILPKLELEESIEITKIYSAAGLASESGIRRQRPLRTPHHTASVVAVVGGGQNIRPGEISLAHRGVLFLDELPEFPKAILESLRQPLESGVVHVARAKGTVAFPAKFCLISAMNPCPCGYYGDADHPCVCSASDIARYQKKISGPLLDRIDLQINVTRVHVPELRAGQADEKPQSPEIRAAVERARAIQKQRFAKAGIPILTNSEMTSAQTEKLINLDGSGESFLNLIADKQLSARAYFRLLKTARTIADLEESATVSNNHLAEAFGYRLKEVQ